VTLRRAWLLAACLLYLLLARTNSVCPASTTMRRGSRRQRHGTAHRRPGDRVPRRRLRHRRPRLPADGAGLHRRAQCLSGAAPARSDRHRRAQFARAPAAHRAGRAAGVGTGAGRVDRLSPRRLPRQAPRGAAHAADHRGRAAGGDDPRRVAVLYLLGAPGCLRDQPDAAADLCCGVAGGALASHRAHAPSVAGGLCRRPGALRQAAGDLGDRAAGGCWWRAGGCGDPTPPLPSQGRELQLLLPHLGGGWEGAHCSQLAACFSLR
jgi:hypothetical protein